MFPIFAICLFVFLLFKFGFLPALLSIGVVLLLKQK